jgi:hypothetical protein
MNKWLFTVALYLTSYAFLLQPEFRPEVSGLGILYFERVPAYSFGGEVSRRLFAPLQRVDQMLRPKFWRGRIVDDTSDLDIPLRRPDPSP